MYQLTHWGGYKQKKWTVTSSGKDVEKLEFSHGAGGNVSWCSCFGRHFGSSSKSSG